MTSDSFEYLEFKAGKLRHDLTLAVLQRATEMDLSIDELSAQTRISVADLQSFSDPESNCTWKTFLLLCKATSIEPADFVIHWIPAEKLNAKRCAFLRTIFELIEEAAES